MREEASEGEQEGDGNQGDQGFNLPSGEADRIVFLAAPSLRPNLAPPHLVVSVREGQPILPQTFTFKPYLAKISASLRTTADDLMRARAGVARLVGELDWTTTLLEALSKSPLPDEEFQGQVAQRISVLAEAHEKGNREVAELEQLQRTLNQMKEVIGSAPGPGRRK